MKTILLFLPFAIYVFYILFQLFGVLKNKESNTSEKFSKGNSNYANRVIFYTIIATMIGPGFSYGAIDKFQDYGFFYSGFYLLTMLQFWLFGHFFAAKIRNIGKNSETVGDFLGFAYGKGAQIITGILTMLFSIAIVGVISLGGGKVVANVLNIDISIAILFVVGFITLYSFYGGISAVIRTDKFQFGLILSFLIIGIIAAVYEVTISHDIVESFSQFTWNSNDMSMTTIVGIAIAFFFGEAFLPVYSIRGIISENPESAKKSFKYVAYFGSIWFIALTFIGIAANMVHDTEELAYLRLIRHAFEGDLGILFLGVAVTAMISVVMSTLDSILNTGGVSFRKDIVEQIITLTESQKLSYARIAILIIAVLGILITQFEDNIVNLLIWAYTIWVPVITFPLGYYLIRGQINNKMSGLMGMLFGGLGWFLFEYILNLEFPSILAGIILNVIVFFVFEELLTNKKINAT